MVFPLTPVAPILVIDGDDNIRDPRNPSLTGPPLMKFEK